MGTVLNEEVQPFLLKVVVKDYFISLHIGGCVEDDYG